MLVGFSQPVIMDDVPMNPTTLHNPERSRGQGERAMAEKRYKDSPKRHKTTTKGCTRTPQRYKPTIKKHKKTTRR